MMNAKILFLVLIGGTLLAGCASVNTNTSPIVGIDDLEFRLDRSDIRITDDVSGVSERESYLMGVFQIIRYGEDGENNYKVLWIPFFEDSYVYDRSNPIMGFLFGASTRERAYHDALSKSPNADVVLYKRSSKKQSGIPFLYSKERVEYKGKALEIEDETLNK